MIVLSINFGKNIRIKQYGHFYVCYAPRFCMSTELKRKEVCNLFVNTHERIEIYREFYHFIIYIANEGRQFRLTIIVN